MTHFFLLRKGVRVDFFQWITQGLNSGQDLLLFFFKKAFQAAIKHYILKNYGNGDLILEDIYFFIY
jgi:hypothetical protein